MKCLRCGKDIPDDKTTCEYCGYDITDKEKLQKVFIEVDPEVEEKNKIVLIDMPVLTLIFGIVTVFISLMIAFFGRPISLILIVFFIISFALTFIFSTRPCKVKLKPLREFGIILGFIGFVISAYSIFMWLFDISNVC